MPHSKSWGFEGLMSIPAKSDESVEIREVWADNLEAEIFVIREIVDEYHFVAMDTEFPGIAITPVRAFKNIADQHYQTLRANVDLPHLIQIGNTFCDASSCLPPSPSGSGLRCVWQFNFRELDPNRDVSNPNSQSKKDLISTALHGRHHRPVGPPLLLPSHATARVAFVLGENRAWEPWSLASN